MSAMHTRVAHHQPSCSVYVCYPTELLQVMADPNLITYMLIIAASTGLRRAHKIFMMMACSTLLRDTVLQRRDELWCCIQRVCC